MPTYEYICSDCGNEFEVFQRMSDPALDTCNCGKNAQVKRKIGRGAGLIFKGGGFYETDFKDRKGTPVKEESPKAPASQPCGSNCGCAASSTSSST
jgi:putative FmdB family regulatory protein